MFFQLGFFLIVYFYLFYYKQGKLDTVDRHKFRRWEVAWGFLF